MDSFYQTQITKRMMEAFRSGNVLGAMIRAPFAAIEQAARPIMEYVVPRQKLGVFADLAQYELERLGTNSADPDVQAALARAWDSVDNRLGQLVYDNLFWHKVVKDLAMGSVRSVGWNVGTVREIAGGLGDTARFGVEAARLAGGKGGRPDFTPRMSYVPAIALMAGLLGAILYYLWHGHAPRKLKDYYAIPDAHGRRWALPSYMKDMYHYGTDPLGTMRGKIHPLLTLTWEMLSNKDYFDHPIRNRHHSAVKQALELAEYAAKTFEPIALRSGTRPGQRRDLRDTEEKLLPIIGITRAPKSIDNPRARHR
jgi:hypothetical protein